MLSQSYYAGGVEGRPPVQTFFADGHYLDEADDLDAGAKGKPGTIGSTSGTGECLEVAAAPEAPCDVPGCCGKKGTPPWLAGFGVTIVLSGCNGGDEGRGFHFMCR